MGSGFTHFQLNNVINGPMEKLVTTVMEECGGVKIIFPPPMDTKVDAIKLHGPKEDMKKVQLMLQELVDEQVKKRGIGRRSGRDLA